MRYHGQTDRHPSNTRNSIPLTIGFGGGRNVDLNDRGTFGFKDILIARSDSRRSIERGVKILVRNRLTNAGALWNGMREGGRRGRVEGKETGRTGGMAGSKVK